MCSWVKWVFILVFFADNPVGAQTVASGMVHRYPGGIGLFPVTRDLVSALGQPAAAAVVTDFSFGIRAERFTWPGSPIHGIAGLVLPTRSGNFSMVALLSGVDGYQATEIGLGYARKFSHWLDGGIRINLHRATIAGYGASLAWPVDAGLLIKLNSKLSTDIAFWNILRAGSGKLGDVRLPLTMRAGLAYQMSEQSGISVSLLTSDGGSFRLQASVFYRFHQKLMAQMHYRTGGHEFSLMVHFSMGKILVDLGLGYHGHLGAIGSTGVQFLGKSDASDSIQSEN